MNQMIHGIHLWIRKGIFQKLPQSNWAKGNTFAWMDPQNSEGSTASQEPTWVLGFHNREWSNPANLDASVVPTFKLPSEAIFLWEDSLSLERGRCRLRPPEEETCFPRNRQLSFLELFCPWNLQCHLSLPLGYTALFRNVLQHNWNNHLKIRCESVPESGKLCPTFQLCPAKWAVTF